ncbi:MAG: tautomerase family protein [Proteobacteria bacterium]|nr:tautomerase family protein [Pseudomonadota bacterium]
MDVCQGRNAGNYIIVAVCCALSCQHIKHSQQDNQCSVCFLCKVVENLAADPGIDPANVLITIVENHDIDWSFRNGIAQFVI